MCLKKEPQSEGNKNIWFCVIYIFNILGHKRKREANPSKKPTGNVELLLQDLRTQAQHN